MKNLVNKVIGSIEEKSLEQRIYNGMVFLVGIFSILITIANISVSWYYDAAFTGTEALLCCILFFISHYKNKLYFLGFFLISAILLAIDYFYECGIDGPIIFFLAVMIFVVMLYNPVKWHTKVLIIFFLVMGIIFTIEYLYPSLVHNPYKTNEALHSDKIVSFVFLTLLASVGISLVKVSYEEKNKLVEKQNQELGKVSQQKNQFIINTSHEIRTPLTVIGIAFDSYISRKGEDNDLLTIKREVNRMERDMLNYLTIANIERGRLSYEEAEIIQLDKYLNDKIGIFTPFARGKDIFLDYKIDPNIYVNVSPQGINQILNNLLHNAIKFSPEKDTIKVELTREKMEAVLTVQNKGAAIPAEKLDNLFNPYYQLSHKKLDDQGMGMGLSIVKGYIDQVGGQITVTSNKDQGTVFTVKLISCKESKTIKILNDIRGVDLDKTTIKAKDSSFFPNKPVLLLVENEESLLCYLVDQLKENYNIYVATNGKIALNRLKNEPKIPKPAMVVSDIMMDVMDGYELLENTLADSELAGIPFIFLTAKNKIEEQIFYIENGAVDYITKPFKLELLKAKIKSFLAYQAKRDNICKAKEHFIKERQEEIFKINVAKYALSKAEIEVVLLVKEGKTDKEIAFELSKSEHTVSFQVASAMRKVNSKSRTELTTKMAKFEV